MTRDFMLSERAQILLKALVDRYVREGHPVGSRALVEESGLDISPATVRNIMADLEEMGLVSSPHTSAGRVPTGPGYRLFVDTLLTVQPLQAAEIQRLETRLAAEADTQELLASASALLSAVSKMAGVVMLPRRDLVALKHVEFLPLSDHRVLVVLVIGKQEVQNRVIHTARNYSAAELQQAANYINARFAGRKLAEIRLGILQELREARERMNEMTLAAVELAGKALDGAPQGNDCLVAGQTNLMNYEEMSDMERLRQLFEAFSQKQSILHLLDAVMEAQGMHVFIGAESGHAALDTCSVVATPYGAHGEVLGVLGVIGPTRMAYNRMIPIVDMTAKLLGAALNARD